MSYGVLVGYDGSEHGERALAWAAEEALVRRVRLTVCHSWHPLYADVTASALVEIERAGEQILRDGVARAKEAAPGLEVEALFVAGSPGHTLIEAGKDAELLVVGAHGYSGVRELLLGSVSAQVAQHAAVPVVVVREPDGPAPGGRIVVGVDGSREADHALDLAFAEAALRGAPLAVVHALEPFGFPGPGVPYLDDEGLRALAEQRVRAAVEPWRAKYPDVAVQVEVRSEPAVEALLTASASAALLVLGSRGLGQVRGRLLGSVSQHLLHHASCPVAVVRG